MEIVVTAMTKVQNMVCLAGINLEDNSWVRPTWRTSGGAWPGINYYQSDALIEIGDVIWLKHPEPRPTPPHTEDVLTPSFSWVRIMDNEEFRSVLWQAVDYQALDEVMSGVGNRSLCLIQPSQFKVSHVDPEDKANTRLSFWLDDRHYINTTNKSGFPCTDLRWRAFCRDYGHDLDIYQHDDVFLAIGLTRPYNGICNPMVVSVITFPSFDFTLDPRRF